MLWFSTNCIKIGKMGAGCNSRLQVAGCRLRKREAECGMLDASLMI